MQFLSLADLFFIPPLSGQNLCFILSALIPMTSFFFTFPRPAVNSDLYLNFCRDLTFILMLSPKCQDLASPSEMIWEFGHKQVSPGCTLSEEAVDALLPKETSTLLHVRVSTKLTNQHGKLHLSKISSSPFNFEAFPRKVNKPRPDVSSLAVPGGPAQGLKLLRFLIVLQWGSTQECEACWWVPAPSWQEWQCGGSLRSCLRSYGIRRSKFVTSPYHVHLVQNINLFSVFDFQLYGTQRVVGNQ